MNRPNLNTKPEQKLHANNDKSVSSLFRLHALNVMLPVFAAVRRRACNMAPAAIDVSCPQGAQPQLAGRHRYCRSMGQTDRCPTVRPCSPYYSRSVSNYTASVA